MKVKCKGTLLQAEIAGVFTSIAQLIDLDGPEADVETFDSTTLDTVGAGKECEVTGYADPGEVKFNYFLDPVLAVHKFLTSLITTPAKINWKLIFADDGATEWPFAGIFTGGGPKVDMGDGLKSSGGVKLSGLVTYPT